MLSFSQRDVFTSGFFRVLSFFVVLIPASYAAGPVIGLPENTLRVGVQSGLVYARLRDPMAAETNTNWTSSGSIVISDWLSGGKRYWLEGFYQRGTFSASESRVGQQVEQGGAKLTWQYNVPVFAWLNPWVGAGFDVSFANHIKRHTKDSDNYLLTLYSDRAAFGFGLDLNIVNEWTLTRDLSMAAAVTQSFALASSVSGTGFNLGFMYRL